MYKPHFQKFQAYIRQECRPCQIQLLQYSSCSMASCKKSASTCQQGFLALGLTTHEIYVVLAMPLPQKLKKQKSCGGIQHVAIPTA
jgi:hypothetical protein